MAFRRDSGLLRRTDTFLMVIDLQEPLMRVIQRADAVAARCVLLMEAARLLDLPIIVTVQNRDRLGDLIPEVRERLTVDQPIRNKMTFSCMRDEAIAADIAALERRQALLCGVETHVCVHQTAQDLRALGYEVHVAEDAVSSRSESNREAALRRFGASGITITSAEMAIYELMERAGTDEFRRILPLVR